MTLASTPTITANGSYPIPSGKDGWDSFAVNVAAGSVITDATASASDVLSDKVFYNNDAIFFLTLES